MKEILNLETFSDMLYAFILLVLCWWSVKLSWRIIKGTIKMFWWLAVALLVVVAIYMLGYSPK